MIPISNEKRLLVLVIIFLPLRYPLLEPFVYHKTSIEAVGSLKLRVGMIP
jgi:hypothetical protein